MPDEVYIGLDLGGTNIRAGRYTSTLALEQRSDTLTLDDEGLDAVFGRMIAQIKNVWPAPGSDQHVAGIGVSVPGPVDPVEGVVTHPPNLQGWQDVPLRRMIEEKFDVPVYLGNDANLGALAEFELGAGRGYKDMIYLTISTGIGSGIIVDGKLLIGSRGLGGECGHLIIIADGEHVSTLEKEAAGPALARQAVAAIKAGTPSKIKEMVSGNLDEIAGKTVGDAARVGDALALQIVARAGKIIGLGIVSLLHAFNPQIIIIGGGVAKGTKDLLLKPMREAIETYALDPSYWQNLVIAPTMIGEDVCLIGAGALALRRGR